VERRLQLAAEILDGLGDLRREFAGGREDKHAGLFRAGGLAGRQAVQDRQRERRCLAGAGLRQTDDVAAFQHRRDRLHLDGRRRGQVQLVKRVEKGLGQAELRKQHTVYLSMGAGIGACA
jgi:hypothetical protein